MRDLEFGVFITPSSAQPDAVVELAVLADEVGLDLATFQDHPYQPQLLDAWTLISYVAARTRRIKLAPNVTNLPLRPPAVMARAAAGLDLLSGGRVELGIGAGGFWDAIEAMGGRRLTPGQGVDALEEAIDIMRELWADGGRVSYDGRYYELQRASRGPKPAHDIGLWIGAYKPRMLALTGRKGDGWLPSLPYLQPGDLARGNAAIDAAAREAGRDPGEIRRMLNLPPASVDEVLRLAREERIDTFIFMADDPRQIQSLAVVAEEARAAWREEVAGERAAASRGAAAGATRWPGAPALEAATVWRSAARRSPPRAGAPPRRRPAAARGKASGITPTPDDGVRRSRPDALGRVQAPAPRARPRRDLHRPRPRGRQAPDRRPRHAAQGARRAARPRRAGPRRGAQRRRRALDAQRDGAAPERLDAGRVLLALLPRRGHAPLARGRLDLPAPAGATPAWSR